MYASTTTLKGKQRKIYIKCDIYLNCKRHATIKLLRNNKITTKFNYAFKRQKLRISVRLFVCLSMKMISFDNHLNWFLH